MIAAWTLTFTREDVTLAIAILGAGLGVLNVTRDWWRQRVRLKVGPTFAARFFRDGTSDQAMFFQNRRGEKIPRVWGIEVINKGVPVKIKEVGFLLKGSSDRAVITEQFEPAVTLPHLLERHDSVTIFADIIGPANAFDHLGRFKAAFVTTTSGRRFSGSTRAFKRVAKKCLS
jgi:hypothetical protein